MKSDKRTYKILKSNKKTLFLNDRQKDDLLKSILKKNEIPHKFAYLNEGAHAWDFVSNDQYYEIGRRELNALKKVLTIFSSNKDEFFSIVHIGPGNGIEISTIVKTLDIQRILSYALLDISPEMLKIALSCGQNHYENLNFLTFHHDITKPGIYKITKILSKNKANKNLIFLIANGAILSNSPALTYIRKAMTPEDRLIITLEVYSLDREKQILEQYKLPSILNLFAQSLSLIGISDPSPDQFEFTYNKKKSMVEVYFHFIKWAELHRSENITVGIPIPEKIKVFSSLRPTQVKLKEFIRAKRFKIELFQYFENEKCCGVVCRI